MKKVFTSIMIKLDVNYSTDLLETLISIHGEENSKKEVERILAFEINAELKRKGINRENVLIERILEDGKVCFYVKQN